MAAALGEILILDLDGVGPGTLQQPHGALDIECIAVAGVGIDDEVRVDTVSDQRHGIDHLAQADQTDIRAPQSGIGDGRAGDIERIKTGRVRRSAP